MPAPAPAPVVSSPSDSPSSPKSSHKNSAQTMAFAPIAVVVSGLDLVSDSWSYPDPPRFWEILWLVLSRGCAWGASFLGVVGVVARALKIPWQRVTSHETASASLLLSLSPGIGFWTVAARRSWSVVIESTCSLDALFRFHFCIMLLVSSVSLSKIENLYNNLTFYQKKNSLI
ncbi:BnaC03g44860D [Brassica napus]|uniref:Uncharacterized protein n=2 Tax=Brassica TaxID=3705 RepID=A0A3P6BD88_BRAOL|nr:unnamed protein product [Brassica napus]CDY50050.1 BnaC03g44860D [Brassica napus]VDC94441.1 unnamed protein product [Brassica oleracea]